MEQLLHVLSAPSTTPSWQSVMLALLLAFLLSMVVAVVYTRTHQSLSYSRSYVQSLVLGGIVAAILMLAIGNNLARGIGIAGTLAIIRFRSTMKDPRDMIFIFAAMAVGIATGAEAHAVAIAGTAVFSMASLLLRYAAFGTRQLWDGLLRIQLPAEPEVDVALKEVLKSYCRNWVAVSLREVAQGKQIEHAYHVKLRDPEEQADFIAALEELPRSRSVAFFLQQATIDV